MKRVSSRQHEQQTWFDHFVTTDLRGFGAIGETCALATAGAAAASGGQMRLDACEQVTSSVIA